MTKLPKIYNWKKTVFSINVVLGKPDICTKKKVDIYFTLYIKIGDESKHRQMELHQTKKLLHRNKLTEWRDNPRFK
jgi:hypothetical protein